MWILAVLLLFMASETGGEGDVYYSTGKAPGQPDQPDYWFLGIGGEGPFAGPYVNREQARKAAYAHARGRLGDAWYTDYQASPHGTGFWAWRRRGLAGPFSTPTQAAAWIAVEEGQGA